MLFLIFQSPGRVARQSSPRHRVGMPVQASRPARVEDSTKRTMQGSGQIEGEHSQAGWEKKRCE